MILETVVVGSYMVNCYILAVAKGREAVIIDPGDQPHLIKKALYAHSLTPACVINTHGHVDHISADDVFGVSVYAHASEVPMLRSADLNLSNLLGAGITVASDIRGVDDGARISEAGIELQVIHTPGHTPGGMCLLMHQPRTDVLFSGDTLFFRGVGRTDFPGASENLLLTSIRTKLFPLPECTVVLPGHGPRTTIGQEKKANPFVLA